MRSGDLLRQLDQRLLPHLVGTANRLAQGPAQPGVLLAAVLLSCLAVTVTAVWGIGAPQGGAPTADEMTRVGVAAGESIPGYLQDATDDLEALPTASPSPEDDTFALVSLSTYLTPHQAANVFGNVPVAAVIGRVPLPERQTEVVRIDVPDLPGDVITAMADLATRKEREAGDYRAQAAAVSDGRPEQREQSALYLSAAQMAEAEAKAYRGGCACVYAAVVRAEPVELRQVASQPDVRVVDPAPEVHRLDRAVFTPPLPEQEVVAHPFTDSDLTTPDPVAPDPVAPDPVAPDPVVPDPAAPDPVVPDPVVPDPVVPDPVTTSTPATPTPAVSDPAVSTPDPEPATPSPPPPTEESDPAPVPEVRKSPSISSSFSYPAEAPTTPVTSANAVDSGASEPVSEGEVGPVAGGPV
ncbi:hypothetical protein [Salinispora cortesiana]|uniref:hypothetical protein n=1 Tax=Salinispora cortesiana TaxID=1305843 RepID=UPI00040CEC3B|nr:hypothetical protein [Salinispora cortesiana]